MPQSVTYTARRSLTSGHTAGSLYGLDLTVAEKNRGRKVERATSRSLNGTIFTNYHHGATTWNITTTPLTATAADALREFLDSVEDGQVFGFDPHNWTGVSPSTSVEVVMDSAGYTERRAVKRGGDQTEDRYVFTFTLREVPA